VVSDDQGRGDVKSVRGGGQLHRRPHGPRDCSTNDLCATHRRRDSSNVSLHSNTPRHCITTLRCGRRKKTNYPYKKAITSTRTFVQIFSSTVKVRGLDVATPTPLCYTCCSIHQRLRFCNKSKSLPILQFQCIQSTRNTIPSSVNQQVNRFGGILTGLAVFVQRSVAKYTQSNNARYGYVFNALVVTACFFLRKYKISIKIFPMTAQLNL